MILNGSNDLNIEILKIKKNEEYFCENTGESEYCIVIFAGKCDVQVGNQSFTNLGERTSVFNGLATSIYISIQTSFFLTALSDLLEIAIIVAKGTVRFPAFVKYPKDIKRENRGMGTWSRQVYNILDQDDFVNSLIIGETISKTGVWSGYPPHRHQYDCAPAESKHEEIYYVRTNPANGFGIFMNYVDDVKKATLTLLSDGDMLFVKDGYHSVVAAAGYEFYYLWVLVGVGRELRCNVDTTFNHIL